MPKADAKTYSDMDLISPPHRLTSLEYHVGQAVLKQAFAALDHQDAAVKAKASSDAEQWASSVAAEHAYSLNDVVMKLAWGVRELGACEARSIAGANPEALRLMASALADVILLRAAYLSDAQPIDDGGPL